MPKDTTSIETTNANKVFDLPVQLQPGHVNTMSFPQDSISSMHLTPGKELEISFHDGSKVQIENFQELVNSAQSCGKDTIIQLSDNTIIYPEDLNAQLAQGPVSFNEKSSDGSDLITLNEPPAGQIVEKSIEPGHEYKMGFDTDATASAAQAGQNLILTFKDGGVLVMKNYFTAMNSELPPALTLADGSVVNSQALLTSCKIVETPSFAQTVAAETAAAEAQQAGLRKGSSEAVPNVEPAAGDEASSGNSARQGAAKKGGSDQANVEPAAGDDAVADIEPAAGNAGALSGGRGGYGFASEPGGVSLNGLSSIGAIGATALDYQIPTARLGPTGQSPATTAAVVNTNPFSAASQATLDESGEHNISGKVTFNFGSDGPSQTVPPVQGTGAFAFGGSTNGSLTSGGNPVTVTFNGNTYTGTANGVTVFTLVVQSDGAYTFTQNGPLDHADGTDANDVIVLNFGVVGTDKDGDTAPTSISINVLDDAPVAADDGATVGSSPVNVSGNVLTNDTAGFDGSKTVTAVTFNGATVAVPSAGTISVVGTYGTLVIGANGAFTYTSKNTALGTDQFTYTMKDFDGDTDTAVLSVQVTDLDTVPVIGDSTSTVDETGFGASLTVSGSVASDFKSDAPGSITANNIFSSDGSKTGGNLTSAGVPVTVALAGNTYTGTANGVTVFTLVVNSNGSYTYTQFKPLDHADKANPDDAINLHFGVVGTDSDNDTDTGTINIIVKDDGPTAFADVTSVSAGSTTATGNVLTNDKFGADGQPSQAVTKVTFNGVTKIVPADGSNVEFTSANGKLVINKDGAYSYTSTTTTGGKDVFTYVIADKDGDTDTAASTATLTINIDDIDYTPTVTNDVKTVDETNLNTTTSVTGSVSANFFSDGSGPITGNNSFSSGGSKLGAALTSGGVAVAVTQAGNVYTGKAGNDTVFTLTINADGTYSFVLNKPLDHADAANPDDVINLNFGIIATDGDGDVSKPGTITINVKDDGPTAVADNATVNPATHTVTGNVTTNDNFGKDGHSTQDVTKVLFNGTTYTLPANGTNVTITSANGVLTINKNGDYSYTSTTTTGGKDVFTYVIQDRDHDTDTSPATSTLTITTDDIDSIPTITNDSKTVDETNLGPVTVTGSVVADFKVDGPGTISADGKFTSGGSQLGNALTSGGVAVAVTQVGNVYTGKAGNDTVFTLTINANGSYSFVLNKPLDHADKTNPDDIINLNFGVIAKDSDNDTAAGTITINVKDDGPVAVADTATVNPTTHTVSGNVVTNDNFGKDGHSTQDVTKVVFNNVTYTLPANGTNVTITSANGVLTINKNGDYSYTSTTTTGGKDVFTYVIQDRDHDTDTSPATSTLTITTDDIDSIPTVTNDSKTVDETDMNPTTSVTGSVTADYKVDGPGTISADGKFTSGGSQQGGALTSGGVAVVVTQVGNVYTGKAGTETVFTLTIGTDGKYTFVLNKPLDHADKTNPDDIINLHFGVVAKDSDNDTAAGTITINVKDDGPTAVVDTATVNETTHTVSGNVTTNDNFGKDGHSTQDVTKVVFNNVTYTLPANGTNVTITSANGVLTINKNGEYSYTATTVTGGKDVFTYVIQDRDHDTDTAASTSTLTITTNDIDYTPTVTNDAKTVDETNLGPVTVIGSVTADYKGDVAGSITGNGGFSSDGSKLNNALTSGGVAVAVTQVGNVYTGKAGNETVFTLTINANGSYSFVLNKPLDHANAANPDDAINLNFGVVATDGDGDKSTAGQIVITVKDDGPVANDDVNSYSFAGDKAIGDVVTGNVVTGLNGGANAADKLSKDGGNVVSKVSFNGTSYDVPSTGVATVQGNHGTLKIAADGSYTYTVTNATDGDATINDAFVYILKDKDGDTDPAILTLSGSNCGCGDDRPVIGSSEKTVDETAMNPTTGTTGTVVADYLTDGPGKVTGNNSFTSDGSKLGGALTSDGVAVVVTQVGNVYTGKAGNDVVFTLTIGTDGKYTFVLNKSLDHANAANPDDAINLNFGVVATDADADVSTPGNIKIIVKDDGPQAVDDTTSIATGSNTATGNVLTNDKFGQDGQADQPITKVTFNNVTYTVPAAGNLTVTGAYGTLVINKNGAYSYTSSGVNGGGTDKFTYTIKDGDGDTDTAASQATLTVTVNEKDDTPTVTNDAKTVDETNMSPTTTVTGSVSANYFSDGPGKVSANGGFTSDGSKLNNALTSGGVAIAVTQSGNVYTGKAGNETVFTLTINADGSYSFVLNKPLDHANAANPDDAINLKFGVVATDADADVSSAGTITITVKDDGPIANDDVNSYSGGSIGTTLNGNVVSGLNGGPGAADKLSKDGGNTVVKVSFNGTSYDVPANGVATVEGTHGTLKIAADGTYTYKLTYVGDNPTISDTFEYIIKDKDGDTDPALLTLSGADCVVDAKPTVTNDAQTVDETNMGPTTSVAGKVTADYSTDGPGVVIGGNKFSFGGSALNNSLTSGGVAVVVTQAGNVYTGKAGNETVFTLTIGTDGKYTFVLDKPLDHANASNPNDAIDLSFGIIAKDNDGDMATGTIKITVLDDGPSITSDAKAVDESNMNPTISVSGKVTADYGSDGAGTIHANNQFISSGSQLDGKLTSNGVPVIVTLVGDTYYGKANGVEVFKLALHADGSYDYTQSKILDHADKTDPNDIIVLDFGVKATDHDGDVDNGHIKISVLDDGPTAVPTPSVAICVNNYKDVELPTAGYAAIVTILADGIGQGQQVLKLTLTGIGANWNFYSYDGGVYNAAAGTWTKTLAPGEDFDGQFYFKAPSSVDLTHLNFTAVVSENGYSSTESDEFNIYVGAHDAAAKMSTLAVSDDSSSLVSDHTTVSKVVTNDNLPDYSQVIESDHSSTQTAINSFVYSTSSTSTVTTSTAVAESHSTTSAEAVATSAAEELHQVQSHVG